LAQIKATPAYAEDLQSLRPEKRLSLDRPSRIAAFRVTAALLR
jgi:hypothetical protein